VLPGHTPFFTSLRTGQIVVPSRARKKHYRGRVGGPGEVLPDHVSVVAHVAERAEDARTRPGPRAAWRGPRR